jgi:hypothetical protein
MAFVPAFLIRECVASFVLANFTSAFVAKPVIFVRDTVVRLKNVRFEKAINSTPSEKWEKLLLRNLDNFLLKGCF